MSHGYRENKNATENLSILVVDDDRDILAAARLLLRSHFKQVVTIDDPSRIAHNLTEGEFGLVLLDMNFHSAVNDGSEGFHWLQQILLQQPDTVIVMMTAFGDVDTAVKAIKLGATDFVLKPWHNEKVLATLGTAAQLYMSRQKVEQLKAVNTATSIDGGNESSLLGESSTFTEVLKVVQRVAPTDANVLITGENGTGKEMIAREIHRLSRRSDEVFVSIDLGAVPENLFESELFGHKKGAFTGADKDRVGRLQAANGGTLFLDEIGNLPLHLQSKLLTALEQRKVMPVGGNQYIKIDVRLLSATNMPMEEIHNEVKFRQDLLFRINTVELRLPPLRERKEDISVLANHFLEYFKRKYHKPEMELSAAAMSQLQRNPWRGNVRELRHAIERAIILNEGDVIDAQAFSIMPIAEKQAETPVTSCNLEEVECSVIKAALKNRQGNISKAAKDLGITRASLYRRMEKYEL
ncbi:sigma-54 dependent transcriptional regulator [Porticoccaceae bacterium LTM1]|nr:sigma-54 dependent transcriptional regulator [Porticoccaceae bacterium LTM1]